MSKVTDVRVLDGEDAADLPGLSDEVQVAWASRSQIPAFVNLARTVREHKVAIYAAVSHGLSNARVERLNTRLRLLMRRAFGFHSPDALIALAMLNFGGLCPTPTRPTHNHMIRPTERAEDPEFLARRREQSYTRSGEAGCPRWGTC
jgi:hypothetical protein